MLKVVYQGTRASFSEQAAREYLKSEIIPIGKEKFIELFEALEQDQADLAVVPIENTLIGSIWENYDLIHPHDITIIGEHTLRIEHCLLGQKNSNVKNLKKVYSHPKALDQCRLFFKQHPWIEPVVHYDTAGAAEAIAERNLPSEGAIASIKTQELYGLELLQRGLEDNPHNFTRFLIIKKKANAPEQKGNKCTLLFTLKHQTGALAAVLQQLSSQEINVTKIESRPLIGKPFEYLFYVDLESKEDKPLIIPSLESLTTHVKNLGIYKCK